MNAPATPTLYAALGGDAAVRALVDRFYDLMDADPALAALRSLHAADLAPMRSKLADWMSAWLGGPQHYFQRPDTLCFRAAHSGFAIDATLRDQWLDCMYRALADTGTDRALEARLRPALAELADFLRNR
ncbi:MAG TPA: group II truncated hemoglobin [Steroidobacteraceae bacterium]|nr:group II truncated hemoglobin [Steroidobacteraceae bacterium]